MEISTILSSCGTLFIPSWLAHQLLENGWLFSSVFSQTITITRTRWLTGARSQTGRRSMSTMHETLRSLWKSGRNYMLIWSVGISYMCMTIRSAFYGRTWMLLSLAYALTAELKASRLAGRSGDWQRWRKNYWPKQEKPSTRDHGSR